jgi:hypothetical protein
LQDDDVWWWKVQQLWMVKAKQHFLLQAAKSFVFPTQEGHTECFAGRCLESPAIVDGENVIVLGEQQ